MRFMAYRDAGEAMMGVVAGGHVAPIAPREAFFSDPYGWAEKARQLAQGTLRVADADAVVPVPPSSRVFCVGLNYRAHAEEADKAVPAYPTVFGRWPSTLVVDGAAIPVPRTETGLDWEVELAAIIGESLADVDEQQAVAGVFGYTAFNDVSARARQFDTSQWTLGKNSDQSGPIGPVIVSADEYDPAGRRLRTRVNGEVMQDASTSDMVFSIGYIISYISQTATLRPGDVIATGTPNGVGFVRKPPRLLFPGDVLETEVEGIGILRNPVTGASERS